MHHHGFVNVLRAFGLSAAAVLGLGTMASAGTPQARTEAPAYFRFMLGDYEVTVLWDGTVARQMDQVLSKPALVREAYQRDHQALPVAMSINTFLINTGSRLVLIDSGGGHFVGDRAGRLIANMRASGYRPEQIDSILLTHLHPDHCGGLSDSGRRVFPNALIHVNRRDLDYWLGASVESSTPIQQAIARQAHAALDPYLTAGRLRPFDGVTVLFRGIRALPAPGHTVGHTAYWIESKGQKLLLWGDIVHSAETQFRDPGITIQFDMDAPAAIESRKRLFAQADSEAAIVGGAHITFPGLGHVGSDGGLSSWVSLPYVALQETPARVSDETRARRRAIQNVGMPR
jgi:glyoxylase-like metal-dependent hydrolase (beta-lactamase superfamily II)